VVKLRDRNLEGDECVNLPFLLEMASKPNYPKAFGIAKAKG
jgi:hypothetical protein